jgi:HAD superfamily hydrolase (TIGR01509 family)
MHAAATTPPLAVARGLALLFDMDGVIIHSTPLHVEAWRLYLKRLGISSDGILERMHGKRNDEIVRDVFGPALSEAEVFEHGAAKERLYRELMAPRLEEFLVPGVREFLSGAAGVPCAVASNAEPANVGFILDGAGLRGCFRAALDGQQVERPKPDPEIFLRAAGLLATPPGDCIVFEDSPGGVTAGLRAGMRVVALQTTRADFDGVALAIPDFRDPRLGAWLAAQRPAA